MGASAVPCFLSALRDDDQKGATLDGKRRPMPFQPIIPVGRGMDGRLQRPASAGLGGRRSDTESAATWPPRARSWRRDDGEGEAQQEPHSTVVVVGLNSSEARALDGHELARHVSEPSAALGRTLFVCRWDGLGRLAGPHRQPTHDTMHAGVRCESGSEAMRCKDPSWHRAKGAARTRQKKA